MADAGNTKAHENTYHGFLRMMKWGTIVVGAVALLVIALIAQ
jgi:hypothetical protein